MVTRTDIYGNRAIKTVAITVNGYSCIYGFKTPIDSSASSALGHTALPTDIPAEFIFGANSPKPARASKDGVSSWIATASITSARQAGWKIVKRPKVRGSKIYTAPPGHDSVPQRGSISVFVETRGIAYAWNMPYYQYRELEAADLTQLKIEIPANDEDVRKMIYGASFPRPGRARKVITTTTGSGTEANSTSKTITTFCGDTADFDEEWMRDSAPENVFAG